MFYKVNLMIISTLKELYRYSTVQNENLLNINQRCQHWP